MQISKEGWHLNWKQRPSKEKKKRDELFVHGLWCFGCFPVGSILSKWSRRRNCLVTQVIEIAGCLAPDLPENREIILVSCIQIVV